MSIKFNKAQLAINGGKKVRKTPFPYRCQFGKDTLKAVKAVFRDSWKSKQDFGYQGKYEEKYTKSFCNFQGGGYADAVCSGTAGIYVALAALGIKSGSDVIVSPVTDPGSVSPILLLGYKPIIADSEHQSYNVSAEKFAETVTSKTKAAILTHVAGYPFDIEKIMKIAKEYGIRIIEDCSQAHGAEYKGRKVGTFGDISVFSTMFSKNHATGGCGGLVYTRNEGLYWKIRSLADRGKPFDRTDFNLKDPGQFRFPALNLNLGELSCAIGLTTLSALEDTISKRYRIVERISKKLSDSRVVKIRAVKDIVKPSLFFLPVQVDVEKLQISKLKFAKAIIAEGININPDYKYVVSEWNWIKKYLSSTPDTYNATNFRKSSFNILFNEKFLLKDVDDITDAILKVESAYGRRD